MFYIFNLLLFTLKISADTILSETETNLAKVALGVRDSIIDYEDVVRVKGILLSVGTKEFAILFGSLWLVYNLTFHGTHFERIPVCFFVSVIFYSCLSRFFKWVAWLERFIPISVLFQIWKIVSMVVGAIFFLFYDLLKPFTLLFIVFMFFDMIDDLVEKGIIALLGESQVSLWMVRLFCLLSLVMTFYIMYKFYRWLKGGYEVFFCLVFALYGGLVLDLAISELFGILTDFNEYIVYIANYGLYEVFGMNADTVIWMGTALGAFIYQSHHINEDYLNDKKDPKEEKSEKINENDQNKD